MPSPQDRHPYAQIVQSTDQSWHLGWLAITALIIA